MGTLSRGAFQSGALEASHVIAAVGGSQSLGSLGGRIDSTAPSATYYVLVVAPTAGALPANGAVPLLAGKAVHIVGTDTPFDFLDVIPAGGVVLPSGGVVALSSTEFSLTLSGAYMAVSGAL